jgi:hypothetical protein
MTRPFWQDEIHHHISLFEAATTADLDRQPMYLSQYQPKFDFWARKVFWLPTFGVSERTMRLPAMVFGIVLVLFVYGALVVFFRRRFGMRYAAVIAFVGSIWIVNNQMAVNYSDEARHYSLVMLASTVWFALLLLFEGKPRLLLGAASLLFANTHFFSLPLIAAGYGLQLFREIRARRYVWCLFHLAVCLGVYVFTVKVNGATFGFLLDQPPGDRRTAHAPLIGMLGLPALKAGFALWMQYSRVLAVPPATWLVWLLLLTAVVVRRQLRWLPVLLAAFGLLPAIFTYMRFRSQYPFGDRYFSAFFGLGLVTLAAGLDVAHREWERWSPRLSEKRARAIGAVGAFAVVVLLGGPAFAYRSVVDVSKIRRIPANFSPWYFAYREIWEEHRSAIALHTECGTGDIPRYYLKYLLPSVGQSYWAFDWCDADPRLKSITGQWLADSPKTNSMILLDEIETDCSKRPVPPISPPVRVEKVRAISVCMWKVYGATSLPQLADVARIVGFRGVNELR